MGPSVSSFSLNIGNSSRHGVHHEAQKFTTSGLPRYAARSNALPVERRAHDRRRRLAGPCDGCAAAARGEHEGQREANEDDRGPGTGRAGSWRAYPALSDPVMFGWIEHTNV